MIRQFRDTSPPSLATADRLPASSRRRLMIKQKLDRRQGARSSFSTIPAEDRSISIFAGPTPRSSSACRFNAARSPPEPTRIGAAGRAGRGSASWRARSRYCRGTGTGLRNSPAGVGCDPKTGRRGAARAATTDRIRAAQDAAYHFMSAMAGKQPISRRHPGAVRRRSGRFNEMIVDWPDDIRDHSSSVSRSMTFRREPEIGAG